MTVKKMYLSLTHSFKKFVQNTDSARNETNEMIESFIQTAFFFFLIIQIIKHFKQTATFNILSEPLVNYMLFCLLVKWLMK